ncbi:MAG: hypothetical protein DMG78_08635 [Acidobacteria bacterium]|nr:MAG: hypothetical protein DMG78_08635 [Acidobacteriota bacterium]
MACRCFHEFGIATIDGDASDLLSPAEVFISFAAELAFAAGPVNPRYSDPLADLKILYRRALFDHDPGDLVAGNQWCFNNFRELRPVSIGDVDIRMANTAGFHTDQDFASSGLRLADFFYHERLLEFMQ